MVGACESAAGIGSPRDRERGRCPHDQGRQVRLNFVRSGSDVLNRTKPIVDYHIYRREIIALSATASHTAPMPNDATPDQLQLAG